MRDRPSAVSDADVLTALRLHRDGEVDAVEHFPVGFGAYHWIAESGGEPHWFVTWDESLTRRSPAELEAAYRGAALLARELDFVVASVPTPTGDLTVPLASGSLSCTRWLTGEVVGEEALTPDRDASTTDELLRRLHAAHPSLGISLWRPLVDRTFGNALASRTRDRGVGSVR